VEGSARVVATPAAVRGRGLPRGRRRAGWIVAAALLFVLTIALQLVHADLGVPSILLLYLTCVLVVGVIGGTMPAVVAAVVSSFLVNWFFTPPTRTWTIDDPEHVFALIVFVLVAVVVSVLVDREARARTEAEHRRTETETLEQVNELRMAILASVSHDLRTPLASIKASVSGLREPDVDWTPEQTDEFLAAIEEETDRLTTLVGNLLDMSRLQTGAMVLVRRVVGLDELVPKALASLPDDARDVEVDVPEDLPRIEVDAELLERAIANVTANARQWRGAGPPVRIAGRATDGRVELRVIDHGPGVPAAERVRMFEPFQRLGDRAGDDGVGLGLAVAQGFVVAMGGAIHAEDTPGGGLTMVLSFDAASGKGAVG
jgi:two-component system, OmpR family, sensor histidine kinase KdpD